MAIHAILRTINGEYPNEPAHIFIDYLYGLYIIKTEIKHLTLHNNHPDKTILQEIVELLQQRTQPTTLYKIQVYANIKGNEKQTNLLKKVEKKNIPMP